MPGIREDQVMATAARDRLARTLRGDAQTAFSVDLAAKADDLNLEVEGFGHVRLPVTSAKARKLLALGQPARFGRGEQTLTTRTSATRGRSRSTSSAPSGTTPR
jgi:hypothetical protein